MRMRSRTSSRSWSQWSRRKPPASTSRITATRRPACASGAAPRWRLPTSRCSRSGLTGPLPRPKRSWPRPPEDSVARPPTVAASFSSHSSNEDEPGARRARGATSIKRIVQPRITPMSKPKVLISDALSPAAVQIFKDRGVEVDFQPNLGKDKDKLAEIIGDYDGLAIRSATKATAKIIERATRLKVIGRAGIGVDNVEIPAATAKGIIVMNTPFGNSITTAEHAITLMLALAREIPQADASTQAGKWEKNRFMGVEITGKVLGVIGCGNIGSIVCDRAQGLRMRVIGFDPFLSPERAKDIGVEKVELDELFRRADFITLHTPL